MALIVDACQWIENTAWSTGIRESVWTYPIIESAHVLTLCLFFGLAVVMDMRLIGAILPEVPVSNVMGRLLPWVRSGFAILVVTGILLFIATPVRFYGNVFFRVKVLLLILAGVNIWLFHRRLYPTVATWDDARVPPRAVRITAALSLTFWVAIIAVGRLIAYNWYE